MSDLEQDPSDSGLTLIELLVTMLLMGVVMSLVGSLLVTTLRTGGTVQNATSANRSAQVVSDSIKSGIRNSSEFRITNYSSGDQLLVARVAGGASDTTEWGCTAWYYSAATDTMRTTQLTAPYLLPLTEPTGWTLLGSGITPVTGNAVFPAGTGARTLDFSFRYGATGAPPVTITSSVVSRVPVPAAGVTVGSGPARCYLP